MTPTTGNTFRDGRIHVQRRMCPTCIFRNGNVMQLAPGRRDQLVADATRNDSAITCHETYEVNNAVCRGFFDRHPTTPLQIARRLDLITYVQIGWS